MCRSATSGGSVGICAVQHSCYLYLQFPSSNSLLLCLCTSRVGLMYFIYCVCSLFVSEAFAPLFDLCPWLSCSSFWHSSTGQVCTIERLLYIYSGTHPLDRSVLRPSELVHPLLRSTGYEPCALAAPDVSTPPPSATD